MNRQNQQQKFLVATFYHFVALPDCEQLCQVLNSLGIQQGLKGSILLATEGINGTIVGSRAGVGAFLAYLFADQRFQALEVKESFADQLPFKRFKVRIKKEIVTFGRSDLDPAQKTGTHVKPQDWNDLISDPEVTVIDTRNNYEVGIGTFKAAQNPGTTSFRDFPDYVKQNLDPQKHKKIAMFCTGGIRCEKASAFLLEQGFEEVYQLKGGILKYLEEIPEESSLWQGECFVFDERVSVDSNLNRGSYELDRETGNPIKEWKQNNSGK